jgi:hypothetical protein
LKNYCLAVILLLPISLSAQKKVDLDKFRLTVQYRSLPKQRLDSTYRTYNVEVEGTKLMKSFLQEMSPEKTVLLEGWRKLSHDGHITVKVKLEDMLPESVSIKERIENIKSKTGQITGTRTYYHEEVKYTFAATASIYDYKGAHVKDEVLASRNHKLIYNSPEFAFKKLAEGYFMLNALSTSGDLYRNCVNRAIHDLNESITYDFGFSEVTARDYMWIIDSRKHPEYSEHRQAFQKLNNVLFGMNASQSLEGAKIELKPVIDYFERIKKEYSSNSRHDRKIRYASYFNLAVLYYYLDDPQMMMKEASGLILNDFDSRDGKAFEESALRLKELFQQSNIYTRHFSIDPSTFKGPFEINSVTSK